MRILASICTLVFAVLLFATPSHAQSIELFGGYSFVRAPVTFAQTAALCPVPGCHTSGSFQGANAHLKTYLFGPQLRFPGPVSPFAHFLVGGAHESINAGTTPVFITGPTQNAFATALGVGIDLKVLPFLSIRPIQIDYLLTHFNSTTQNQPRASAGLVLRF